jgi:hypothetical protein
MKNRDKFLAEAMGRAWIDDETRSKLYAEAGWQDKVIIVDNIDFSTWDGFGELFMWAGKQDWWDRFWGTGLHTWCMPHYTLTPAIFPDMIYEFLNNK